MALHYLFALRCFCFKYVLFRCYQNELLNYVIAKFQGTWLYTDADCVADDHEYKTLVTCVETGAGEEYSIEMPVYVLLSRDDICNESFADSTLTTTTTASTNIVSVSSTPSQNALQQNQIYTADTLGIWPVYVTLSFLIGGATGCVGHYLLGNKCKKKTQQTR